jgi:hypothetical protein
MLCDKRSSNIQGRLIGILLVYRKVRQLKLCIKDIFSVDQFEVC